MVISEEYIGKNIVAWLTYNPSYAPEINNRFFLFPRLIVEKSTCRLVEHDMFPNNGGLEVYMSGGYLADLLKNLGSTGPVLVTATISKPVDNNRSYAPEDPYSNRYCVFYNMADGRYIPSSSTVRIDRFSDKDFYQVIEQSGFPGTNKAEGYHAVDVPISSIYASNILLHETLGRKLYGPYKAASEEGILCLKSLDTKNYQVDSYDDGAFADNFWRVEDENHDPVAVLCLKKDLLLKNSERKGSYELISDDRLVASFIKNLKVHNFTSKEQLNDFKEFARQFLSSGSSFVAELSDNLNRLSGLFDKMAQSEDAVQTFIKTVINDPDLSPVFLQKLTEFASKQNVSNSVLNALERKKQAVMHSSGKAGAVSKDFHKAEKRLKELEKSNAELSKQNVKLHDDLKALRQSNQDLSKDNKALKQENAKLQQNAATASAAAQTAATGSTQIAAPAGSQAAVQNQAQVQAAVQGNAPTVATTAVPAADNQPAAVQVPAAPVAQVSKSAAAKQPAGQKKQAGHGSVSFADGLSALKQQFAAQNQTAGAAGSAEQTQPSVNAQAMQPAATAHTQAQAVPQAVPGFNAGAQYAQATGAGADKIVYTSDAPAAYSTASLNHSFQQGISALQGQYNIWRAKCDVLKEEHDRLVVSNNELKKACQQTLEEFKDQARLTAKVLDKSLMDTLFGTMYSGMPQGSAAAAAATMPAGAGTVMTAPAAAVPAAAVATGMSAAENLEPFDMSLLHQGAMGHRDIIERVFGFIRDKARRNVSYNDVANYLICLSQGFITTFAGDPGTGKTSLCNILAKALGLNMPGQQNRFVDISVERGWSSHKDFIGYYNPLTKSMEKSNVAVFDAFARLDAECQAQQSQTAPFVILLDEANLSPIEHYWATFLRNCDLDSVSGRTIALGGDKAFRLPEHLRFLATVNFDHTTEELSARFLDRSWVIMLEPSDISEEFPEEIANNTDMVDFMSLKIAFGAGRSDAIPDTVNSKWQRLQEIFRSHKMQLTPRNLRMVRNYCAAGCRCMQRGTRNTQLAPLDYAFAQKILPLINGTGDNYRRLMDELLKECDESIMPVSFRHLTRIKEAAEQNIGFYQFFSR